ncbi:GTP-dependent dephospho-CoA kinase family protein [Halobacteria archaeon AArc-m2/3/4]|uniref:GTP-dependent dephospho-CoA kinase n=1 Tax=Natronoglomus mannanivorans TaxID=2979990 RepID=A0ABT2QHH0_9EURY|nr:GTP-dependent dephospho-CoA kinase family protein [Halobacteria archaeon AArc-m2/3/4]
MTREPDRDRNSSPDDAADQPLLSLPTDLRDELKEPFGPIETDAEELLERAGTPIIAVGDMVTYHLRTAGTAPDVSVVDGQTERQAVDAEIREAVTTETALSVEISNPPAVLTEALVLALVDALERPEPTTIVVDGEEDLAALPAIVAAPDGASVVYGQPGEGMVHVTVTETVREEVRALLERFEGDRERLWTLLS